MIFKIHVGKVFLSFALVLGTYGISAPYLDSVIGFGFFGLPVSQLIFLSYVLFSLAMLVRQHGLNRWDILVISFFFYLSFYPLFGILYVKSILRQWHLWGSCLR